MGDRTINVAPGATYIERQENHFHDRSCMVMGKPKALEESSQETDDEQEEVGDDAVPQDDLKKKLLPFFYNDDAEVERFVEKVRDAKPVDVTATVNELLRERKISDMSCLKPLWKLMHLHGLYERTYTNWEKQIRR